MCHIDNITFVPASNMQKDIKEIADVFALLCHWSVDGYYSEWSKWGPCSRTCGGGAQQRNRTCIQPLYGGANCQGLGNESQSCNEHNCPGIVNFLHGLFCFQLSQYLRLGILSVKTTIYWDVKCCKLIFTLLLKKSIFLCMHFPFLLLMHKELHAVYIVGYSSIQILQYWDVSHFILICFIIYNISFCILYILIMPLGTWFSSSKYDLFSVLIIFLKYLLFLNIIVKNI